MALSENRGNSASMRMSMMNTKFVLPNGGGVSGHLRNNKSISIANGPNQLDHPSMISSHRKKPVNQHSRNNSQKVPGDKDFFS